MTGRLGQFAVMWCCDGLEAVQAVPTLAERSWAALGNKSLPDYPNINMWMLRARYNPQRNYEIYVVETNANITAQHIRDMFEESPQTAADTIRRLGRCMHSDRATRATT
jgi:hypothetical protein